MISIARTLQFGPLTDVQMLALLAFVSMAGGVESDQTPTLPGDSQADR